MREAELATYVGIRISLSRAGVHATANTRFSAVDGALAGSETDTTAGIGTFSTGLRPARRGRNPRTGEEIAIGPVEIVDADQALLGPTRESDVTLPRMSTPTGKELVHNQVGSAR